MAAEKITYITTNARSMGKTFRQGLMMGVQITLENLWIPIDKRTPPLEKEVCGMKWSKEVIVLLSNGEISTDYYWKKEETNEEGWSDNRLNVVTHWMPIPKKP